jgi:iron(III) transport system ATP-binding protein
MEAIRAQEIVKTFGAVRALDGVSIGIEAGELFFLLGGSGCGKTTLLRCIAGLEAPDSGQIIFDEKDVTRLPTHKRQAAMVFQSYALWPHMNVGQNIAFGLEERKVPKPEIEQRVAEVLKMVRMEGFESRKIDHMSGGQQQRVSLARALVVRPKCLLLDEPLSNLDAQLRLEMRSEIRRIVKENHLTGVYVTHDQAEALSIADRMAVMDAGRIVQVGTPEDVYRRPNCSYVAAFIGETNLLSGKVTGSAEGTLTLETKAGLLSGHVTTPDWSPVVGDEGIVSVRPEALQVVDGGGELRGKIMETIYLGNVIQYQVALEGGGSLQVAEMNPRVVREPGETIVGIDVEVDDVVVTKS